VIRGEALDDDEGQAGARLHLGEKFLQRFKPACRKANADDGNGRRLKITRDNHHIP